MGSILVTGAAGFLGLRLLERLSLGGQKVVAVARCPVPGRFEKDKNVVWLERDIALEPVDVDKALKIDAVVHLAGATLGANVDECTFLRANEATVVRLLQSCGLQTKRVVFASSQVIYGDVGCTSVSELTSPGIIPETAYACSKLNSENWLKWFQQKYGGVYLSLRFSGFIEGGGAIDYIIDRALRNESIELYSKGVVCRDYLSVEKGIDALIAALQFQGVDGFHIFNIGSGQPVSLLEIAKHICDEVSSSSAILLSDHPAPQGDFVFNLSRATKYLDFTPDDLIKKVRDYASKKKSRLCNA